MLDAVLREGFRLALRRLPLVLGDLLWKVIWFVLTAAGLLLVVAWFGGELRSLGWNDTENHAANVAVAFAVLREFWAAYHSQIFAAVAAVLFLSVAAWFLLEAAFWSRIVPGRFNTFLIARVLKFLFLTGATFVLASISFSGYLTAPPSDWRQLWPETRGAVLIVVVAIGALGFLLTVIETLIRGDAIDLLGTDLFRVTGLIGILLLFETMIIGSCAAMLAAGFLSIGGLGGALMMGGTAVVAIIFVSVVHSYLLLVRFSAIGIMRQNVVEI